MQKFVCKTWYDLVSDPEFAKLHLDQAQPYPIIQISSDRVQSRMLYLVQPEEEDFELKIEMCNHSEYKSKCDCRVKFELDTKFKLPLRNLQMVLDDKVSGSNMLDHVSGKENNKCIRLKMKDHKYRVVNSCNGLLCLSSPSDNVPLIVCNPITSEFTNLPNAKKVLCGYAMRCGFGFSPSTNQYKVIRIFQRWTLDVKSNKYTGSGMGAEVHTLGTETWKHINLSAQTNCGMFPTYLNGFLFWPPYVQSSCVISFEIENECFGSISLPVPMNSKLSAGSSVVGVLGGELSTSFYLTSGAFEVLVLKDYGTSNAWSKVFSIQSSSDKRWPSHNFRCQPIKYLNDGALLMFHSLRNHLIYIHPRKQRFRYFKISGTDAEPEVMAHISSFVSLKDALSGHNVKVLKSSCARLKLLHEGARIRVSENITQRPSQR